MSLLTLRSAFKPTKIAGCKLWLAADRIAGIADAGAISQWDDLSGNGFHATGSGLDRPTLEMDEVNGRPIARFNGTNDEMTFSGGALDITKNAAGLTAFLVVKVTSAGGAKRMLHISNGTSGTSARVFIQKPGGQTFDFGGRRLDADSAQTVSGNALNTAAHILTVVVSWSTSDIFGYKDGALDASSTSFQTDGNTSNTSALAMCLGSSSGGNFAPMDLGELILYNRAVTDGERAKVRTYLSRKWGVVV